MTKTKPKSDIEKAEKWLDQLDPSEVPARAAGEPWSAIGMSLGTTRQAAYQRFGQDK